MIRFTSFACAIACATGLATLSATAIAAEFTYPLTGSTAIIADEGALKFLGMSTLGEITIAEDGAITGQGVLIFTYLSPCRWTAPLPEDDYNCIIANVEDGAFQVTGKVVEWVHRHDEDKPLKDAIFAYADGRADSRPDYAPYRISLTLSATGLPAENLVVWGLTGGNVEDHRTGVSALGMLSAGLFDVPFELLGMDWASGNGSGGLSHSFSGRYQGGAAIAAGGVVALSAIPYSDMPHATDPQVYQQYYTLPNDSKSFTPQELANMQITQQDSRSEAAEGIYREMQEMLESGVIPQEMWAQMGAAFSIPTGSGNDPDLDPVLLEALDLLGKSGRN